MLRLTALIVSTMASAWAIPALADEPSLEAGIAAYRAGQFSLARDRFLQAQAQGENGEALRFNLALSYYKLADYPAAQHVFESLRASPDFSAVAEYHLGLVAAQTGDMKQAATHWRTVQAMPGSPDLQQLAGVALQRIGIAPSAPKFSASVSGGGGVDSNRTQSSDTLFDGAPIDKIDPQAPFAELSAAARYRASSFFDSELRGSLYARDYLPDRELDQTSAQLSLRKSALVSDWQTGAAVDTEAVWLGGDHFQNAFGLNLDTQGNNGASSFSLRYRPSLIAGGNGFEYLDGWSQRAELGYAVTAPDFRLSLQYEVELNDRRDLALGDEFFSQSPVRQGLSARLSHRLRPALSLAWNARYRYSRYRDPSHLFDGSQIVEQRRVDKLIQAGVSAALILSRNWGLRLDYRYSDNQSGIGRYEYDRHDLLLALDWVY